MKVSGLIAKFLSFLSLQVQELKEMTERISDLEAEGRELTRQLSTLEARIKAYQVILEAAAAATELVCCVHVLLPRSELPKI